MKAARCEKMIPFMVSKDNRKYYVLDRIGSQYLLAHIDTGEIIYEDVIGMYDYKFIKIVNL